MSDRPIIFLDMDGVLASPRAFLAQGDARTHEDRWIDDIAVRHLSMVCTATQAFVVISSTWRIGRTRANFVDLLGRHGFQGDIHMDWKTIDSNSRFRGDEVQEWLGRHPEVKRHVILDDETDYHPGQPLVRCDTIEGMLYRQADMAHKLLSMPL